jgi:Pin2-interacting protein X1
MGLGAVRSGRAGDETFGLEVLSGVLGRLNGRSDEVLQKESEARRDARLSSWQVRKWGGKGFVSGGFLVTKTIEDDSPAQSTETEEKEAETMEQISSNSTDMEDGSRFKLANDGSLSEGVSERKRLKLEKRARKEARRLKREKRRQNSEKSSAALTPEDEASEAPTPVLSRLANSEVNSPSGSATPVSDSIRQQVQLRRRPGTRHAVRPDQKALNEVSDQARCGFGC